jgi:hypothetical protein
MAAKKSSWWGKERPRPLTLTIEEIPREAEEEIA